MRDLLAARLPFIEELVSTALYRQIRQKSVQKTYADGQLIHHRGESKPGLSIVQSGSVRVGNIGADGSYLTTSVLTPGHSFGEFTLLADLPRTHEAVAVGPTIVMHLSANRFHALYRSAPEFGTALLKISLLRTHAVLEFVDDLRRLPLPVRVAKFFLANAETEELRLRHEDLSFTFGVSRVSMGKTLKHLEAEGLLTLGYGRIRLHRPALETWVQARSPVAPV